MSALDVARMIDISAVRTQHFQKDIDELVRLAKAYHFINVHVLPSWVHDLAPRIKDIGDVYVGSPVGFPSGGHTTSVKLVEAYQLISDGAQEVDIVMNIGKLKDGQYDYVLNELKTIIRMIGPLAITKVIIEINVLTDAEMFKACELVMHSGASFVKTGTGWIPGGANIDRIKKLKEYCGNDIKIKAAGGIRTREDFLALYDLGVERMGINTNSAVTIVESFK
ncbi:MAG: deoxyribose-phosphate aldolase [Clostridia bacterium]